MAKTLFIFFHNNCLDGVLSSAIFTRFMKSYHASPLEVLYRGMNHGSREPYGENHEAAFTADINAVLDFRYSPSARLDWWCDHHVSTFLEPDHGKWFRENRKSTHCFDPQAPSCAGLLARWLQETQRFDITPFADHVKWADIIDAARFESASQAVELEEPALKLMALLEAAPPKALIEKMICSLVNHSIDEVQRQPEIQAALHPILEHHQRTIDIIRRKMSVSNHVAFVDLTEDQVEGFNKFIPYYFDPQIAYTVVLTHSSRRAKVSVGTNPFTIPTSPANIAELCHRYGGGGHPRVGAVTISPDELPYAKQAAQEILAELTKSVLISPSDR